MASGGVWKSNICPECGKRVEILNGNIQFSMDLHFQSHKSLDTISQEIEEQMKNIKVGPKKSNKWDYTCPQCQESVVIINNDISLSLKLHTEKHKSPHVENRPEDQSSISSGKSKGSDKKPKSSVTNPNPQLVPIIPISILDGIFDSMAPGLKMHRGFVSENENGKAFCNICKVAIDSLFSMSDHLKTKSHEDKTITFLTNLLPSQLHKDMEFVSFYGSNLCCNLCRGKIDLCSENPYKTIISIMGHNYSKIHQKINDESSSASNAASGILKSLAKINPIVDNNKHHIECKMEAQFKCKLCDKAISYDQNENVLYKNFYSHFTCKGHIKCSEACSVLEAFNLSHFPGKEMHNLTALKGSIYCTVCHCPVAVNLKELIDHVKKSPTSSQAAIGGLMSNSTLPPGKGGSESKQQNLKDVLNSLPTQLRNTTCVTEDDKGQAKCLTCNTVIPATTYNIQTHLLGKSHKSKLENAIPTNKQSSELTEGSVLLKNIFEQVPVSLRNNLKFIRAIPNGKLHCTICNADVPAHTVCLEEHLEGAAHKKSVNSLKSSLGQEIKNLQNSVKENLLDKLMKNDTNIKNSAKYLELKGDHYKCSLCSSKITQSTDENTLKTNILVHMNGQKHKTSVAKVYDVLLDKLESVNPVVKTDRQFLKKEQGGLYCSLCSCHISAATEFNGFKTNLLSHLTGNQHLGNKTTFNERNASSSSRNLGFVDPTKMQFFKSYPIQDDIPYLKNSAVEGYLSCTLCNTIINPVYLREHLEDVNHIQKKSLVKQTSTTPNTGGDQEFARGMQTLITLLSNIDKKLPKSN